MPALLSHSRLPTLLLFHLLMPALLSLLVPVLSSRPFLPALLFHLMPALLFCPPIPTLLSPPLPVLLSSPMPALLSPFVPVLLSRFVLSLALTCFISSALRTFKQALSDEHLGHQSTSPSPPKLFCLFPILDSLLKKSDCKRFFNTAFINSRPLATNHAAKEVDLSFVKCGYPASVKLNRLWQLELLDHKPVCIIEAIPLAVALF